MGNLKDKIQTIRKLVEGEKALPAVHMQAGGDPTQMFNFNPMAAKAAKQKQMRESTPETPLGALSRGFATGLFGSIEDPVPYTGSIMEGSPERQQSQANLRELGRNVGALTDIGGMVTPFAKPAAQAVTRGATALGKAGLEQVDRAMFGEGPLAALVAPVAPLQAAPRVQAPKAATIPTQEVTYETTTDGPFYRIRPSVSQAPAGQRRGTLESDGTQAGQRPAGGVGSDVPQPITNEAVQQVMADPANFVRRSADTYTQDVLGKPYELPEVSESSIFKQAPIGRAFMLATTEDPTYKQAIFNEYARQMPDVVKESGAKNYDELLAASYKQLAKETDEQFKRLPISLSYHRAGEGNYRNSKQMLQDVYGNKHLYVFQGGDEHPYLKAVDPITGLNENEKFRAVHDFFGHAVHGNEFGPKGEEIAWAAHSQMYSPLARLAMSTETRGQNSTVNYTPLNAALKRTINELNMQRYEANRRGKTELVKEIDSQLKEAWNGFQFAPQKPVLLPPEFLSTKYEGEMPDYLRGLIKPEEGTFVNMPMMHFSQKAGLTETDPAFYGTGIKGEEAARLGGTGSVRPRTYFYTDEGVTPEPGLGPHRYRAMGENLYDLAADPLMLNMLARETTRIPMTASSNKGLAQPTEATNALERLIRDYGYAGYINPQSTKPSAVMFGKVPVTPYKKGGAVRISDNLDTMRLELMRAPRMQDGGSTDQFFGRTAPRGVSSLPGYGQGKENVQQAITALEESPVGRIASGAGELAEGYMSGAGSTDLQKIGQGLSMIPMLGLPATVAKTTRAAKAVKPVAEIAADIKPKFKAPQDKVLLEAQRNAALPVEQGGLGLPPDNTADMRAAAMNYQDYFHGTERLDRLLEKEALDPRRATSGPMPFGAGETEIASRYAISKRDTSRLASDEGNVADYFTVSAKDLGSRSKADVPVEKAFYFLPREKQQEIISKMSRIGYENPREATGDIVLHPEGTVGTIVDPKTIDYYMKREAKGNPLTALRMIWHDSGTLYNNEEQLAKVFELAGFPLPISQKNAPWSSAQGVLTGKARLDKPLVTTDTAAIEQQVIPALKQAFAKDRTRKKPYGPDQWAKDVRFTPKEWVEELEKDMAEGKNSYVWTSIPDKVTSELRKLGFDGILDVGGKGGGSEYRVVIPFDTKQVRSRFAAFDPKNKDKPGLLKAKGGKVHISDNPDTMRLELLRKKHA